MVLKITCPCGTPYSLGEHLAGRTFKCTSCGRVLKVGQPKSTTQSSAAAAPARAPSSRTGKPLPSGSGPVGDAQPGMEWSTEWGQRSQQSGERPAPPPRPAGGLDLVEEEPATAEDSGLMNSLESEERERGKSGRRSARVGKSSGRSARQSGEKRGASGRQAKQPRSSGEHAQECPVCNATIARVARECPSCGAVLRGPSVVERVAAGWQNAAKGIACAAVAIGAIAAFLHYQKQNEPPQKGRRPNRVASTDPPPKPEQPKQDPPPKPDPQPDPQPKPDPPPEDPPTEDPPPDDPPETSPPPKDPPRRPKDPKPDPAPDPALDETIVIPPGPHEAAFKRLRDATSAAEVEAALAGLAQADAAAFEAASQSIDGAWRLRVHRARLRAGDDAARRAAIEASLANDVGAELVFATYAALALDAQGFEAQLLGLPAEERTALARVMAQVAYDREPGLGDADLERACERLRMSDAEARPWLAPLLVMAGDCGELEGTIQALDHADPRVQKLARQALISAAAGAGPGSDADAAAWRTWAQEYRAVRDLLARACAPSPEGQFEYQASYAARRELIRKGPEALRSVATFLHDRASRTPHAGLVLGDLIARVGRPEDAPVIAGILSVLGSAHAGRGGVHVLKGALIAADREVLKPVADAIMRGAMRLEDAEWLPPLCEAPTGAAPELVEVRKWIDGLSGQEQLRHGRYLLGSLRDPALADVLLEAVNTAQPDPRLLAGARLGSAKLEGGLVKVVDTGKGTAGFKNRNEALAALTEIGTETAARGLLKHAAGGDVQRTIRRIGSKAQASAMKKEMEANPTKDSVECYADLAGADAIAALEKRAFAKDGASPWAADALLLLLPASNGGRKLALEKFEAFKALSRQERGAELDRLGKYIEGLARSGKPSDGDLLLLPLAEQSSNDSLRRVVSAALGRLGYHGPTADVIRGYVTPGLRQRGYVALALARMGRDEGSVEDFVTRMRATLEDPKVNLCSELDSQVLMAMALLDPEAAAPFAAKMREQALNKPRVPEVLACSFVLTLTGHEEHLGPVLKSTQEATREALARGIAWAVIASTAQGDFPKAPPVLDDLRLDPAPRVQAFAAVAAGHLELDGAEADLRVALCAPERLLDPPLLDQNRDFAYLARTEETSLRALLWGAHAAVKGKEPPAWRRSLSTARLLEITRQLRSGR